MKKLCSILLLFIALIMFASCSQSSSSRTLGAPVANAETHIFSSYSATEYAGMDVTQAETELKKAGFTNIEYCPIEDITSVSSIADGTVESVQIDNSTDFDKSTAFFENVNVIITYHNIPKITAPVFSEKTSDVSYIEVAKMYFDAGFSNISTEEIYDIDTDSADGEYRTELTANGVPVEAGALLPFDSEVVIVGHFPYPKYSVALNIDFEGNLIFSRYDVIVSVNSEELGTLAHGKSNVFTISLPEGSYTISFTNAKDNTVAGSIRLNVNSDTKVSYHITCHSNEVKVEQTDLRQALQHGMIMMPFSSKRFLRKDCKTVVSELESLGFTNIIANATTDNVWGMSPVDSIVQVKFGEKADYNRGDIFSENTPVKVLYHVPDFAFEQSAISVTEREAFALAYNLTSGDGLETINFTINNKDILKRNEDGTYTALMPGQAIVTATSGDHICSECTVEVKEIIVPIDSIELSQNELTVAVGGIFSLDYTYEPKNANYTDITTSVSNSALEQNIDGTFYSAEQGDTEIEFYQDKRRLGTCVVHSTVVEVEEFTFQESMENIFVGQTAELGFTLVPETASNKGITVASSNPGVADVSFDEKGDSIIQVTGVSAGKATISVTIPNGTQFQKPVTVEEILPTEIQLTENTPDGAIRVGSLLDLTAKMIPENTSDRSVVWTSSNSRVIKVDAAGILEAVGVGIADVTAKHKSGMSATISITVQPTPVEKILLASDHDRNTEFVKGNKLTLTATILPENATDKSIKWTSSDETIVTVSDKGVVTAKGMGTAEITAESRDGVKNTMKITVDPSPQKFRVSYSCNMRSNNHVGNNWSKELSVDDVVCASGSVITVEPGATIAIRLVITENDSRPDSDSCVERIPVTDELCRNGYATSGELCVRENGGRYSGNTATWSYSIQLKPVN